MRIRCLLVKCLLMATTAACLASCQLEGPETGSAAIQLHFSPPPFKGAGTRGLLTGIVDSVRVTVSHGGKQLVSQTFGYEDYQGAIEHIPAGEGRVFVAEALAGEDVVYQGTQNNVTIAKGQTATVQITMEPAYTVDVYPPAPVQLGDPPQVSGSDVILSWTAVGDDGLVGQAASYDLRRADFTIQASNFDSATPIAGVPSPAPSGTHEQFTVTGLTPGQTYHFAMKVADDDENVSPVSNEVIETPGGDDPTPPGDITDLAVSGVTDTTATLTWTAPGDDGTTGTATTYDVRYLAGSTAIDAGNWDSATEATGEPGPQAAGSGETFTVTGLSEGQEYYFAVKTCDEIPNCSGVSNSINATPADTVAPAKVNNLSEQSSDDTSVTLQWTSPGDDGDTGTADHYDIRYLQGNYNETDFDTNWATATIHTNPPAPPQAAGNTETTTIGNLATGAMYTFALKAYDEVPNESPISNTVTIQVGVPDNDPPQDVTDLAAAVINETTVQLTWTAPDEDKTALLNNAATAYDIRYLQGATAIDATNWATATEVTGEPAPQAPGSAESLDVTGLTTGTQYYFALMTVDDQDNWSDNVSNSPTATPADINLPEDIDDLTITGFDEASISLSWTAPGDDGDVGTAFSYDIRYSESPIDAGNWASALEATGEPSPQVAGSTETFMLTGLDEDHHYYVRMTATDDNANESGMSNEVDQLLPCPSCPVVSGIRPPAAPVGTLVSIDGSVFEAAQGTGTVTFGGEPAVILSWSDTQIVAEVPPAIIGTVTVMVTNTATYFTTDSFDVTPHIDSIQLPTITLPASIVITGSGFGTALDTITFTDNGTTAPDFTITGWDDTQIDVDVTSDVVTGPVKVTVGSYDSNTPLLTITGDERSWTSPAVVDAGINPSTSPRAASENSDVQVVWTEKDPFDVDLEVLGKAKVGVWQTVRNISNTTNTSTYVEVVAGTGGVYHLAWMDSGPPDTILYTNGKDNTWIAAETVAAEALDARPAMGLLPDGSVVVAWSTSGVVRYNTRPFGGNFVSGDAADVLTPGTNAASIAGAVDPAGNFHIVFINGTDLVHAWFDGGAWHDGGTVAAAGTGTLVALAADGLGALHALWWDATDTTLKYAYRNVAGWTAGTAPAATMTAATPEALDLVVDAGDVLHAAVEDDSVGVVEVYHFSKPQSGVWSAAELLSIIQTPTNNDDKQPCLVANEDLSLFVVWAESDRIRMVFWQ